MWNGVYSVVYTNLQIQAACTQLAHFFGWFPGPHFWVETEQTFRFLYRSQLVFLCLYY